MTAEYRLRPWHSTAHRAALAPFALAAGAAAADSEAVRETVGRTHMALVHFPIALIAAALFFEFVRVCARRDRPSPAALASLAMAGAGAAAAALAGWWHADFLGRSGEAEIELHRWVAIAGGSLAILALGLGLASLGAERRMVRRLYVMVVVLAAGTITLAGHQGGELVYGEGYVLAPLRGETPDTPRVDEPDRPVPLVVSFDRDLLPVFEARCIECHGPAKQNGKLRLDSLDMLRQSPYFAEVVVAGDAARSSLHGRITLPQTDPDFMPKRAEPLSAWEIEVIRRWIESLDPSGSPAAPTPAPTTAPASASDPDESAGRAAIAAMAARGGHAAFESARSTRIIVNLAVLSRPMSPDDLAVLEPVADRIVELNLGGVGVTDDIIESLPSFQNLERLNISRSSTTAAGLAPLARLERLGVLNLYGSTIGNDAVPTIAHIPALRRVYIWNTSIDSAGAAELRTLRPDLEVIAGAEVVTPEPEPEPASTDDPAPATDEPAEIDD